MDFVPRIPFLLSFSSLTCMVHMPSCGEARRETRWISETFPSPATPGNRARIKKNLYELQQRSHTSSYRKEKTVLGVGPGIEPANISLHMCVFECVSVYGTREY